MLESTVYLEYKHIKSRLKIPVNPDKNRPSTNNISADLVRGEFRIRFHIGYCAGTMSCVISFHIEYCAETVSIKICLKLM